MKRSKVYIQFDEHRWDEIVRQREETQRRLELVEKQLAFFMRKYCQSMGIRKQDALDHYKKECGWAVLDQ